MEVFVNCESNCGARVIGGTFFSKGEGNWVIIGHGLDRSFSWNKLMPKFER